MGIIGFLLMAGGALAQKPAPAAWADLSTKRELLSSFHQEFEVSQTSQTASSSQSSKRSVIVDAAPGKWREKSITGSGTQVTLFDGTASYSFEDGGEEFVRTKYKAKDPAPRPSPYRLNDPDWTKAVEVERRACGMESNDHQCIVVDVPLKPWTRTTQSGGITRMTQGGARVFLDLETGLMMAARTMQIIEGPRGGYSFSTSYVVKRLSFGNPADASLFALPSAAMREVKELSSWDAAKIKKQLVGKPAPELTAKDLDGKPVDLAAFKGKTVLLDFWTTWCPPCRADGPALDKLHAEYGDRIAIVGISVSEDRPIVEKFLQEHPHKFPIVLTTENELPRPYQVGVFPTYIVIDRDGLVFAAVEGDQGFSDLRKLLKKAGLQLE